MSGRFKRRQPSLNCAYPAQLNRIKHTGTEPETTGIESIQKRRVTNQNEQIDNTPVEAQAEHQDPTPCIY
jgi:hypothetical protein